MPVGQRNYKNLRSELFHTSWSDDNTNRLLDQVTSRMYRYSTRWSIPTFLVMYVLLVIVLALPLSFLSWLILVILTVLMFGLLYLEASRRFELTEAISAALDVALEVLKMSASPTPRSARKLAKRIDLAASKAYIAWRVLSGPRSSRRVFRYEAKQAKNVLLSYMPLAACPTPENLDLIKRAFLIAAFRMQALRWDELAALDYGGSKPASGGVLDTIRQTLRDPKLWIVPIMTLLTTVVTAVIRK